MVTITLVITVGTCWCKLARESILSAHDVQKYDVDAKARPRRKLKRHNLTGNRMARFNTDKGRFDYPNSDIKREFHDDTSQRKYFIKPSNFDNVKYDLTKGYEGIVKRDANKNEKLEPLLKWIKHHELGFFRNRI
ncbi:hypothetical protein MAR_014943 [Mya arenaria]|uniref:RAI1-like domain-containing protein n=1 Tax=Mya arenaria TaxID=6604 RepID=A0ABY7FHZ0_MYAAR|nr:hypothetical protein MAR_014943 [Mya arenaria]